MKAKHSNQINIILSSDEAVMLETVQKAQRFEIPRQTLARNIFKEALTKEAQRIEKRRAG